MSLQPVILGTQRVAERFECSIADGTLHAFTCRSPERMTANEDSAGWVVFPGGAAVLVVADGAGGMPDGKQASQIAVRTLLESLQPRSESGLTEAVVEGMALANETVLDRFPGAATTLTVATVQDGLFRALQVGDSEALLTGQRGRLKYHTTQHSPTGFAVEAGELDERLALYHPERHLVSNFVGTWEMRIELSKPQRLNLLDTIVLASDGLTDNLFRHEIVDLARRGPAGDSLDTLIRVAQTRMLDPFSGLPSKPDDLTILLYRPRVRPAS